MALNNIVGDIFSSTEDQRRSLLYGEIRFNRHFEIGR
jgi:hypothetical protein